MKITKYPQSHLVIEDSGKRLIIDPGLYTLENFSKEDIGEADAVLITHQHPDHFYPEILSGFSETPIYGNQDVVEQGKQSNIKVIPVINQTEFEVAGFKIKPVDLPHCKGLWCEICDKKITPETITNDGKCKLHPEAEPRLTDGPPNTGYAINSTFFHPGGGVELDGESVENAAVPISGPTIYFKNAWELTRSLGAEKVIPIHYAGRDVKPADFAREAPANIEVIVLEDGQGTEI